METAHYRNLKNISCKEWQSLNIHLFIDANFNRYSADLIKKVGPQHLPNDTYDSLGGLFCDVAFKPLSEAHRKHLHVEGERRNQVMLGTLKTIAATRMVAALIKEFPAYTSLEGIQEIENEETETPYDELTTLPALPELKRSTAAFVQFSAESYEQDHSALDIQQRQEQNKLTFMVETLRSYLTPVQYQHLRYVVCDGLSSREIAEHTGHSTTNVRIMLSNARKKMLPLVPEHLLTSVQSCLHRK